MAGETTVSIEDLQKQIADLKKSDEEKSAKLEALEKKNTENTEALNKARDLNMKLLLDNPSAGTPNPEETAEDTIEAFCSDIVSNVNENYLKRFKND